MTHNFEGRRDFNIVILLWSDTPVLSIPKFYGIFYVYMYTRCNHLNINMQIKISSNNEFIIFKTPKVVNSNKTFH